MPGKARDRSPRCPRKNCAAFIKETDGKGNQICDRGHISRTGKTVAEPMPIRQNLGDSLVDQLRAEIAELKAENRALREDLSQARRSGGVQAQRRLLRTISDWQHDQSTRATAAVAFALYLDYAELVAQDRPPDSLIPWHTQDRTAELKLNAKTQRTALNLLESQDVIATEYVN